MAVGYGDVLFFAIIAAVLAFKFFSVLGKKEDDQDIERLKSFGPKMPVQKPSQTEQKPKLQIDVPSYIKVDKVQKEQPAEVKDPFDGIKFANEAVKDAVVEISKKDVNFNIAIFLSGAKSAFEYVLKSYSENDRASLKNLLSDNIYSGFVKKIDANFNQGLKNTITLVSINVQEVSKAVFKDNTANISLKFQTEQINFTKNDKGELVEGSVNDIEIVDDEWSFERNIKSTNPNWIITSL
jgi:predicted lipid-binding transport protein (Tim44 family)